MFLAGGCVDWLLSRRRENGHGRHASFAAHLPAHRSPPSQQDVRRRASRGKWECYDSEAEKSSIASLSLALINLLYLQASSSPLKAKLFAMAMKKKQSLLDQGLFVNDTIWDKVLFKKIRNRIGAAF